MADEAFDPKEYIASKFDPKEYIASKATEQPVQAPTSSTIPAPATPPVTMEGISFSPAASEPPPPEPPGLFQEGLSNSLDMVAGLPRAAFQTMRDRPVVPLSMIAGGLMGSPGGPLGIASGIARGAAFGFPAAAQQQELETMPIEPQGAVPRHRLMGDFMESTVRGTAGMYAPAAKQAYDLAQRPQGYSLEDHWREGLLANLLMSFPAAHQVAGLGRPVPPPETATPPPVAPPVPEPPRSVRGPLVQRLLPGDEPGSGSFRDPTTGMPTPRSGVDWSIRPRVGAPLPPGYQEGPPGYSGPGLQDVYIKAREGGDPALADYIKRHGTLPPGAAGNLLGTLGEGEMNQSFPVAPSTRGPYNPRPVAPPPVQELRPETTNQGGPGTAPGTARPAMVTAPRPVDQIGDVQAPQYEPGTSKPPRVYRGMSGEVGPEIQPATALEDQGAAGVIRRVEKQIATQTKRLDSMDEALRTGFQHPDLDAAMTKISDRVLGLQEQLSTLMNPENVPIGAEAQPARRMGPALFDVSQEAADQHPVGGDSVPARRLSEPEFDVSSNDHYEYPIGGEGITGIPLSRIRTAERAQEYVKPAPPPPPPWPAVRRLEGGQFPRPRRVRTRRAISGTDPEPAVPPPPELTPKLEAAQAAVEQTGEPPADYLGEFVPFQPKVDPVATEAPASGVYSGDATGGPLRQGGVYNGTAPPRALSTNFKIVRNYEPSVALELPAEQSTGMMGQLESAQARYGHPQHTPFLRDSGLAERGLESEMARPAIVRDLVQRGHNMSMNEVESLVKWVSENPASADIPHKIAKGKPFDAREEAWIDKNLGGYQRVKAFTDQALEVLDELAATGLSAEKSGYWPIRGRGAVGELTRASEDLEHSDLHKDAQGDITLTFQKRSTGLPERDPNFAASILQRYKEHAQALTTQRDITDAIALRQKAVAAGRRAQADMTEQYIRSNLLGERTMASNYWRNAELDKVYAKPVEVGYKGKTDGKYYNAVGDVEVTKIDTMADGSKVHTIKVNGDEWPVRYSKEDVLAMTHEDKLTNQLLSWQFWLDRMHQVAYDKVILGSPRNSFNQIGGNIPRVIAELGESGAAKAFVQVADSLRKRDPALMKEWTDAGIDLQDAKRLMEDPSYSPMANKVGAAITAVEKPLGYVNALPDFFAKATMYEGAKTAAREAHSDWTPQRIRAHARMEMAIATDLVSRALAPPAKTASNLGRMTYFLHESILRQVEQLVRARTKASAARQLIWMGGASAGILQLTKLLGGSNFDYKDIARRVVDGLDFWDMAKEGWAGPGIIAKTAIDTGKLGYRASQGRATIKDVRAPLPSVAQIALDAFEGKPSRAVSAPKYEPVRFPQDRSEEGHRRRESATESRITKSKKRVVPPPAE